LKLACDSLEIGLELACNLLNISEIGFPSNAKKKKKKRPFGLIFRQGGGSVWVGYGSDLRLEKCTLHNNRAMKSWGF
jgi:hypothetical protein